MKVHFEINVPDDVTCQDLQSLLTEFRWLVRVRGWRAMLTLPKRPLKPKPGVVHSIVQ